MKLELLYKIADVINHSTDKYRALVPSARKEYMTQVDSKLVKSLCWVLNIKVSGKTKNHVKNSEWNIFETDMDRIIVKMARKDKDFAMRINRCEPTPFDVQTIVRRASFQSLRLKLVTTSYDLFFAED